MIAHPWLTHHGPGELNRCVAVPIHGQRYLVCARCCGLYAGMLVGVILALLGWRPAIWLLLLPLPAMLDWSLYMLNRWRGNNPTRILTGFLLGNAYSLILLLPVLESTYLPSLAAVALYGAWYPAVAAVVRRRIRKRFGW